MATTYTVYPEAFVENIVGTVVTPENAIGAPNGDFTGNTTGAWTAKWRLATPSASIQITPYAEHLLRLHVRRADMQATKDPAIYKVVIRDNNGVEVLSYYNGIQLTRYLGPLGWGLDSANKALYTAIREMRPASLAEPLELFLKSITFVDGNGDAILGVGGTGWGVTSVTSPFSEAPQVTRTPENTTVYTAGSISYSTSLGSFSKVSANGNLIAYPPRSNTNYSYVYYKRTLSENPVWSSFTRPSTNWNAFNAHLCSIAFSPDETKCITVTTSSTVLARLWSLDTSLATITEEPLPAEFNVAKGSELCGCDWRNNLVVVSARYGFYAWAWDSNLETFTTIVGAEGDQFGSTASISDIAISPDERFIALIRNSLSTLYIYDMQNLGSGSRSVAIPNASQLWNVRWSLDGSTVFMLAGSQASSYARGTLVSVYVPFATGTLVIESGTESDYPLSWQTTYDYEIRNGWFGLIEDHQSAAPENIAGMKPIPSAARTKDTIEIPLSISPAILGKQRLSFISSTVDPPFQSTASILECTGAHSIWSPDGTKFAVLGYNSLSVYQWPNDVSTLPKQPLQQIGSNQSTTIGASQVSWSSDSMYLVARDKVFKVDGATLTALTMPTGLSYGFATFRPVSGAEDPYTHILLILSNSGTHFILEIDPDTDVITDITASISFPSWPAGAYTYRSGWSVDGEYLALNFRSANHMWKWNNGAPQVVTGLTSSTATNQGKWEWHPTDKHIALFHNTPYGQIRFWSLNGTVATLVGTSLITNINNLYQDVSCSSLMFADNGNYLVAVFSGGFGNYNVSPAQGLEPVVFKWDVAQLGSGTLEQVPNIREKLWGVGRYYSGVEPASILSHPTQNIALIRQNNSEFTTYQGNRYIYYSPNSTLDPEALTYNADWTIEIETWGDGNAVQLEGIELELEANLFQLNAPTNLQTIATGGNRALVSWDWTT